MTESALVKTHENSHARPLTVAFRLQLSFPTDGTPWGISLFGPYPDGVTYILNWSVGPSVFPERNPMSTSRNN